MGAQARVINLPAGKEFFDAGGGVLNQFNN